MSETRKQGSVERATRAELRKLGCSVQSEALAALAVSLAAQIDSSRGAVAAAAAAAQIRVILADLRADAARRAPQKDVIDEIGSRRAARAASG